MKIEKKENYILITSEEEFFSDFFTKFEKSHSELSNNHLIIQLSDDVIVKEENILLFLDKAEIHQKNGTTFVIICKNVDADVFPESFNIVPTLTEAIDILEMEDIQRDLGF